ncbi:MAG: hypothetical protein DELT_00760 [Desulfovibrio sp.]
MKIPRFTPPELALVGVTILWGFTFLVIRNAMQVSGPLFFVGVRFACAALALSLISLRVLRGLTLHEVFAGAVIGAGLFAGFALQTAGLQSVSASKSAFITAFYVPAVPLFQWIFWKRPPHLGAWIGIGLAFIGLIFMAGPDEISSGYGEGEFLTFLSAIAFAAEIILIGLFAGRVNVRRVVIVQVAVASFLAFLTMPVFGESVPPFSWLLVYSACGLGIMSAVIQSVMNWAQRSISPTRATIIYAGEPIWAGIFGRMAGERLSMGALLGGLLIVLGVLVSGLKKGRVKE